MAENFTLRPYQAEIIRQARQEFAAGNRRVLIVAPCGAGKTVLAVFMCHEHVARGGRVLYLAHRRELLEQAEKTLAPLDGITVMSVQTAARRTETLPEPTMIVLDECHHAAAKTWQTVIQAFPTAYLVGLTATPVRLDGKGLGDCFDVMSQGVTAEWLIENNYLAPYKYYSVPTLDTSGLKKKRGEFQAADVEALFDGQESRIEGDVVKHYRRLAEGQQAICYCPSVKISCDYAARFNAQGIRAAHLDGDLSRAERDDIVERFRQHEIQILCNVDLLGEGFDVPDCSVVIMLRPTASLSLYIQQSMRGMRYRPGKTAIIIDHVANYKRHGAPDESREWNLQGKFKRKQNGGDAVKARECPECYAMLRGAPDVCPECGHVFEPESRKEMEENAMSELELIEFKKKRKMEERCARSLEDYLRIARERGYKPGWAYIRAKARGYV